MLGDNLEHEKQMTGESLAILPNQSLVHTIQARNLVTTPTPNPPNNPTQTRAQKGLEKGEGLIINNEDRSSLTWHKFHQLGLYHVEQSRVLT